MLSTGTVAGVAGFKSPEERALLYLKPGDVVEAEIEHIGVLRNPIISWQEGHGTPPLPACGPGVRTPEQADGATVSWPRDDAKLDRVRSLMRDRGLDALVVRAPDNVLYLTNFWGMKGYDAVVFPVEGEPALICLEPSREDAERTAWTSDLRLFGGYDERDPRPPSLRALDLAAALAEQYEAVGIELSLGTQATDRMVGEPTTFPKAWFDAFPGAQDATPLLNEARMLKTPQEIERMRLANDIAAAAMEHVQGVIRPGMTEAQAASEWLGFVHGEGHGLGRAGRARARLLARLVGRRGSGRSPRRPTGRSSKASRPCSRSGSAPTGTGATTPRTSSRAT